MIKSWLGGDTAVVVFKLPAAVAAVSVSVCGEFNDWSPASHPLTRTDDGHFRVSVELAVGRRWRFRYLLDGERWENDWAADDYVANAHGGEDSVVDLTDISALSSAPTLPPPAADLGGTDPRAATVSADAAPNAEAAPATAGAAAKAGKAAPPAGVGGATTSAQVRKPAAAGTGSEPGGTAGAAPTGQIADGRKSTRKRKSTKPSE